MTDPRSPGTAGFTLIEMLVTIAIMALIAGVGFPALERTIDRSKFLAARATLENNVRRARAEALRTSRIVRLSLPTAAELGLEESRITAASPTDGITFFPDGTSNGGTLSLRFGATRFTVAARPDTGLIELSEQ